MTITLFNISNAVVLVLSLLTAWGVYFVPRRYFHDDLKQLRRFMAAVFTVFALQRLSLLTILRPGGVEIYASQPIILLSIAFIILVMGGTAVMGRHHYLNFTLWVLLLLIPALFLMSNILMIASGNYQPLYNWDSLLNYRLTTPVVFYGRVLFVACLMVYWMLAAGMLFEAWLNDRRERRYSPLSDDAERHQGEVVAVVGWALLFTGGLVPLCTSSLLLHIIYNVLLVIALVLSGFAYKKLVRYLHARDNGRLAPVLIVRRIPLLLGMEKPGTTPWGVRVDKNPFYSGNPQLDSVAQALGVRSADISEYILQQNIQFTAWVSDQRLRHCASELLHSDRKISEIAEACGYNDLPTFTRAFKRQFGMAPSEYRKQEQA